jgi:hypothetical protein
MRNTIFAMLAAIGLAANAQTWEKVGSLQVTDTAGLTAAVAKLGDITGNAMIGAMFAAKMATLPGNDFFGPMRQGGSIYVPVYVDCDKLAQTEDVDDLDDTLEWAVVYPIAVPKDEFVKMHDGAFETNGMVVVKGLPFESREDWDEGDVTFVAFSGDGKWAAASDKPEQVALATADFAAAAETMNEDLVRVSILPKGMKIVREAMAKAAKCREPEDKKIGRAVLDVLDGVDVFSGAVRVCDAGIDMRCSLKTVEGSAMSRIGDVSVTGDPFAFDGGDGVMAVMNALRDTESIRKELSACLDAFKTNGIDLAQFTASTTSEGTSRIVFDVGSALKHFSNPSNKVDDACFENICKDLDSLDNSDEGFVPAKRPEFVSVAIKGFRPAYSASSRFAAILPEAAGKPLVYAATYSLAAIVKAVAAAALETCDDKTRAEVAPFMSFLPKECVGGVAGAYWREDGELKFMSRISADELKGIVSSASSMVMFAMMRANSIDECDED